MSILVDLIVVIIFALFIYFGFKQGLVNTFFSLTTFFLTIILAFLLYAPFSSLIASSVIGEKIGQSVHNLITIQSNTTNEESTQEMPAEQDKLDSFFSIIPSMKDNIIKSGEQAIKTATDTITDNIAKALTGLIINLITIVILLVSIWLLLRLLKGLLNTVAKLPLIGPINKILGGLVGILNGAIIVYVVLWIILFASPFGNMDGIITAINGSTIAKPMYEQNLIVSFMK